MADDNGLASPVLTLVTSPGSIRIEAAVEGHAAGEVAARMEISRRGASGSVTSSQGRTVTVAPGSRDVIATVELSLDPQAEVEVVMTLATNGAEFARMNRTLLAKP